MVEKIKDVEKYIANETIWQAELIELVEILRQANLEETIKWSMPCYMAFGRNVVQVVAFKSYFGLWFDQGVFLEDTEAVLVNANKEKTKGQRQWRMTSASEIKPEIITTYLQEAIELAKKGVSIKPEKRRLMMPPELTLALNENVSAKTAFEHLKPGQKREFADWISSAKKAETKLKRIAKAIAMIENGEGLNDRYRKHDRVK